MTPAFARLKTAAAILDISPTLLLTLVQEGKLSAGKTLPGHRAVLYDTERLRREMNALLGFEREEELEENEWDREL
jgi:hypothetical protein